MSSVLTLAATVHGGSLISFALLMLFRARIGGDAAVVRVYRAWGPGLGLSLGLFWLSLAWVWPGRINPGADTLLARFAVPMTLDGAALACLLVYWVNYVALEIWTLEPCRLLDKEGVISDEAAYAHTASRVALHLGANALLFNAGWLLLTR